jgi:transcriptional regulator GlxA family with amidase domain
MREVNTSSAKSSMMTIGADDVQGSVVPPHLNPSTSLAASTLLRRGLEEFGAGAPLRRNLLLRRGGLAVWQIDRALRYVEGNLGSRIAVGDIADLAGLSSSHFSRAFRQSFGYSPIAYVMTRRIERAKRMMTSTRERLSAIALACGFADQPHFNRHFGRLVGMSPGQWRRVSRRNSG